MKSINYRVNKGTVILGEKWIQKMAGKPGFKEGALRKHFGLKEDEKMTIKMINDELSKLKKKYPEGGYSVSDLKLVRQLNAAKNMMTASIKKATSACTSASTAGLKDKEVDPHRIVLDTMSLEEAVEHENPELAKKNLDILDSELNQLIRDNQLTASIKCTSANSIHKVVENAEGLENALKKGDKHQASEFAKALKNNFIYIRKYYIK